jgi:hypothetical protein
VRLEDAPLEREPITGNPTMTDAPSRLDKFKQAARA